MIETSSWTKKGQDRKLKIKGKRSKRINIIAAKTNKGIEASFLFEGACNLEIFEKYIEEALCPILRPGQIIVMDNVSFHKSQKISDLIEAQQCKLIYLPPYSPELNPIEKYWSVLKRYIKKINGIFENKLDSIEFALLDTATFGLP